MKLTPQTRKALYALGVAAMSAAVVHGLISEEQSTAWLGVLGAALNVLAALNVDSIAAEERGDGTVAGPASDLPDGTPVDVVPEEPETPHRSEPLPLSRKHFDTREEG